RLDALGMNRALFFDFVLERGAQPRLCRSREQPADTHSEADSDGQRDQDEGFDGHYLTLGSRPRATTLRLIATSRTESTRRAAEVQPRETRWPSRDRARPWRPRARGARPQCAAARDARRSAPAAACRPTRPSVSRDRPYARRGDRPSTSRGAADRPARTATGTGTAPRWPCRARRLRRWPSGDRVPPGSTRSRGFEGRGAGCGVPDGPRLLASAPRGTQGTTP